MYVSLLKEEKISQVLIHNRPILNHFVGKKCQCETWCTRTGEKHANWRPKVRDGSVISFATGEREYPKGFCEVYAEAIKSLSNLDENFGFLEIFLWPQCAPQSVGCCLPRLQPTTSESKSGEC